MKKIVRLTESDLVRMIKKVIKENEGETCPHCGQNMPIHSLSSGDIKKGPYRINQWGGDNWYDERDRTVHPDEVEDFEEEIEFGPDDFGKFIEYTKSIPNKWDTALSNEMGKDYYDQHYNRKTPTPIKIRKLRSNQ